MPAAVPDLTAKLANGEIPLLGFGTWRLSGAEATRATQAALRAGYRHVDTATMYDNETDIGTALTQSGLERSEVFVTTKLQAEDAADPRRALDQSLRKLQTPYLDLWLIHWPTGDDAAVWRAFIDARDAGLVRDIGVSNFSIEQIDELSALGVTPAVNQIRWSPLVYDAALVAAHRERGVVLEGYSGLKGGTLDHPVIREIADRLGRTTAQVIIRWHLQHGFVVIPKSQNEERIVGNADVGGFDLPEQDMARLDSLGEAAG